ncbi:MAG: protein phosphatase 2C domain-containing protein, partial [Betaproteobacteria bacterium]|nr:protein phosphatase 2C domain-containing protein [Betaproteobacteria bacterium]
MDWKVFLASATGKYHIEQNAPCQDFACHEVRCGVLLGIVCDGAGSAPEGRFGAEFMARQVTHRLAAAVELGGLPAEPEESYLDFVAPVIAAVRADLEAHASACGHTLRDYAATLVGCIAGAEGGCFFHIGDGFAVHQPHEGSAILSRPENGEYANETYFTTDEGWQDHLRVTPLTAPQAGSIIGLMSDGSSAFAIDRGRTGFYRPFIDPVLNYLRAASESHGNEALHNLLASEKTFEITSDDKTLLLA